MNCLLCGFSRCEKLLEEGSRRFFHCRACGLIFVPVSGHVSIEEEKRRYALHDNSPGNAGYVAFLEEVVAAVIRYGRSSDRILDFGSGPTAVLTRLLRRKGFDCTAYDPNYGIGAQALFCGTYDTVIVCEVIEHLRELKEEIKRIARAVRGGGRVIIRTRLYPSVESFASWWYKNDCTHINFFSGATMDAVAAMLGMKREEPGGSDIFILTASPRPASSP